ncbi:MAG TPA: TonB-dependent receptor [Vicinamibacterales bacterium]|nr:TonB-dependent receptor [Vicinamibacterales bacterium]
MTRHCRDLGILLLVLFLIAPARMAFTQNAQAPGLGSLSGHVADETGGVLPGVNIQLKGSTNAVSAEAVTNETGEYTFPDLAPGRYQVSFTLINFATVTRREVVVAANGTTRVDAVLHMSLNAEVTVTAKRTFVNLADVDKPAENLVGIAQSASQGAITAEQLDVRPLMRVGEVLETVPGMIASSHAGGGKANQYFLRGFNLDHGTDFAQTIADMPVNLPSHAHGQGYSDINFMIPELVSGVQYSKGPYFADQGDFATAGAANTNYVTSLDRPLVRLEAGGQGYDRALVAASPSIGTGHLLVAFDGGHNDGPWVVPDRFERLNGVIRYSNGDAINGYTLTGMAYHGKWTSTDTIPQRAIESGLLTRFGTLDGSDGGTTYRYSLSGEWQHGSGSTLTKASAYGIGSDLSLFSNFTYFLDDPVHGDQHEQADHRFITGGRLTHKRLSHWNGRNVQNTFGLQVRNDDITNLALYHTEDRVRLATVSQAAVLETTGGVYGQNEIEWLPWLRTLAGVRVDATRFRVNALQSYNSGAKSAGIVSPKGGVTFGPWGGTEFYVNAGEGFHSNDARGVLATRDADGDPITPVTPLVKAKGGEAGVRTVALPHLQTTVTVWMMDLDSELTWDGDTFESIPSRPSRRKGVELANYYSPARWLNFDADVSWSQARFTAADPAGQYVPEAVGAVVSAGATVNNLHRTFGSLRWRYFGPRALIEDNSVRSKATSLCEFEAGYQLAPRVRATLSVFNLFNAAVSDIDYYYVSRLPGEPAAGLADIETHPTLPRAARVTVAFGF